MHKTTRILCGIILASLSFFSCTSKVEPVKPKGDPVHMTFEAKVEDVVFKEGVKSYLSDLSSADGSSVMWSGGERISVFTGNNSTGGFEFTSAEGQCGSVAVFSGEAPEVDSYTLIYPYSATNAKSDDTYTVTIPTEQHTAPGAPYFGTDPGALVSIAKSVASGGTSRFHNCFSILVFQIKDNDIATVLVESNGGEGIAGETTVSFNGDSSPEVISAKSDAVTLLPAAGASVFPTGNYGIAVAPGTLEKGYKVIFKHSGSARCSVNIAEGRTVFPRNTGIRSETLVPGDFKYYYITSKSELDEWSADKKSWSKDDVVYLGKDIDYGSGTWAACDFNGTFDGRGHCISNIVCESDANVCGFFGTMDGTVRNVKFGTSDGKTYDGVSRISTSFSGDDAVFCAPVARTTSTSSLIENVTNFAEVSYSGNSRKDLEIAGIVSDCFGTIRGCTNCGNITVTGNVGAALYIGGVCGWLDTKVENTMSRCVNRGNINVGNITINNQIYGGGVLGGERNSVAASHSGLVNFGKVTFGSGEGIRRGGNDNECFIGGCVGGNGSTSSTYSNCENYGDVSYVGAHRVRIAGIASYSSKNPNGAIVRANVSYKGINTTKASYVGGVVGYLNIAEITGLSFEGVLDCSESKCKENTGGITGYINKTCTMSGCSVGGQIKGKEMSQTGLMCCTTARQAISFKDCTVKPGTKYGDNVVKSIVKNYSDCGSDTSKGALCGGSGTSGSSSDSGVRDIDTADPLTFVDGTPVTRDNWDERRAEIIGIFENNMYGRIPEKMQVYTEKYESGSTNVKGNTADGVYSAVREQYHMWFKPDHSGPCINWLVVRPAESSSENPAKTILTLNFQGNHAMLPDEEITIPDCWFDNWAEFYIKGNRATAEGRGCVLKSGKRYHYPIDYFLSRGYALVTATYGEVCADPEKDPGDKPQSYCFDTGVFKLWQRDDSDPARPMALGAWAWAYMRGMDLVETIPELDKEKVVATGVSRLGKAVLIAGACDKRFAVVAPVQTGGGGVPLTKYYLPGKETIKSETTNYTHWFIPRYAEFAGKESTMTFDQHMLVSCIAPRAVFVFGYDNPHFNSPGEFASLKAAAPAWSLWGREPLPDVIYPDTFCDDAIGPNMAYFYRTKASEHGVKMFEWSRMLDFADLNF